MSSDELPPWHSPLAAITGARHGGQVTGLLEQLRTLDTAHPHIAQIAYQLAWTLDAAGCPADAIPHYERAIALGLPPNEHSGALLGLGSSYRLLGELDRADSSLTQGRTQYPANREFEVFLALLRHDQGRPAEALQLALGVLIDTSEDIGVTAHQRAVRHHVAALH